MSELSSHPRRSSVVPSSPPSFALNLSGWRSWFAIAGIGAAYAAAGWVGLQWPYVGSAVTLIWAPTAIAYVAVRRLGYGAAVGVAAGAFLVNWLIGLGVLLSLHIAVGNTLPALFAHAVRRRLGVQDEFASNTGLFYFLGVGALASTILSMLWGTTGLLLAGIVEPSAFLPTSLVWWAGDAMGVALYAPALLSIFYPAEWTVSRLRKAEFALLLAFACVVMTQILGSPASPELPLLSFAGVLVPVWAASRFPLPYAAWTLMAQGTITVLATVSGFGPFVRPNVNEAVFVVHVYMAALIAVGLSLSVSARASRAALQASERARDELAAILDSVSDAIVTLDPDGRVVRANASAERFFHAPQDKLQQAHIDSLFTYVDSQSRLASEQMRRVVIDTDAQRSATEHVIRRDPNVVLPIEETWAVIRSHGSPDQAEDRTRPTTVLAMRDISQRRESERSLRLHRRVIESSGVGVIVADISERKWPIVEVNAALCRLTGRSADDYVGRTLFDMLRDRPDGGYLDWETSVGESGVPEAVARYGSANGMVYYHQLRFIPLYATNEPPRHIAILIVDMTSVFRSQTRLAESELWYRDLAETIPGVSYQWLQILGGAGRYIWVSQQSRERLGIEPEAMLRDASVFQIHPSDKDFWEESIQESAVNLTDWRFEGRYRGIDGTWRWWQGLARPQRLRDGSVLFNGIIMDVTERHEAEAALRNANAEIQQLVFHDSLTGLQNRRGLLELMQSVFDRDDSSVSPRGVVYFVDLDRFKELNDARGHAAGDEVLTEVADRLRAVAHDGAVIARLGGDEFIVWLPEPGEWRSRSTNIMYIQEQLNAQAMEFGKLLRATLEQPYQVAGIGHVVSASIGVATYTERPASVGQLLKRADMAMYAAKRQGRNSVQLFSAIMQEQAERNFTMHQAFHEAIRAGQLRMHLQPQFHARGHVVGAEALIRWEHPSLGMLAPGSFLSIAEECGLDTEMGNWMLRSAGAWAAQQARLGREIRVSVNVTARHLVHSDFPVMVRRHFCAHGATLDCLTIEIVETAEINADGDLIHTLATLRELGVRIALDDFGVAYSSLERVKKLPIDEVKIDRGFISDLTVNGFDQAVVKSVLELGRLWGPLIVAEGVETREQYDMLIEMGCTIMQGYLLSWPLPTDEFNARLYGSDGLVWWKDPDTSLLPQHPASGPNVTPNPAIVRNRRE